MGLYQFYIATGWYNLWPRDGFKILPFAVMQRVARVCQRQLSYWLWLQRLQMFT